MMSVVRKLGPGLAVILGVSLILVFTDRNPVRVQQPLKRIALFKFSSRQTLDDTERGYVDALSSRGFVQGKTISLTFFNAQNDLPTANTIAGEIVHGKYHMVLTASTPALQVMAQANKKGTVVHVFGTVTDPYGAGVGLDRMHPEERPAHLSGAGTFQPVEKAFLIAREMNPRLSKVGVTWCRSESCSEACVLIARKVCDSLGITLMESMVDNSSGVLEASQALVVKGAEALWIGGDNTVEIAADMVIKAAREGGIPVFTNNTDHPALGALFGLGANYYQVGLQVGRIAADILEGADPVSFRVDNVVPEKLLINRQALNAAGNSWNLTEALVARADSIL
jgi:ABC-type uncharacterized transport system substrate-binding protein